MIIGWFGEKGRPFIEGRVSIRALKLSFTMSFIVDTGADKTLLMPGDAARMGLDYSRLTRTCRTLGVGGQSVDFVERAVIAFKDTESRLLTYAVELMIAKRDEERALEVPSLLGRDVLSRWNLRLEPRGNLLQADPVTWDGEAPF